MCQILILEQFCLPKALVALLLKRLTPRPCPCLQNASQVLFVAMDEVTFDYMDEMAPGCVALFPGGDPVRFTIIFKDVFGRPCTLRGTRVPTRLSSLRVPRHLPPSIRSRNPGTYPISQVRGYPGSYDVPDFFLCGYSGITRLFSLGDSTIAPGVPGYLPDYVVWGYPGTLPIICVGGTRVAARFFSLRGYSGTYSTIFSGRTRVPTE